MRRIVNINPIRLARFVEADGGGGPARRGQARDRPQDSPDEIAPAEKHVGDHAAAGAGAVVPARTLTRHTRSEEHTSELQSLMRTSYAVFCLTKTQHATQQDTISQLSTP